MSVAIKAAVATCAAAFMFVVAGCGDDETSSSSTTAATGQSTGGGDSVQVSETEYAIDPADATVKAGTVSIEVSNDGEITHNLEVEGDGVEEELPEDLAAGDSGTLEVDLQPGTYEWYCPIADHRDQGMEGEITVE